MIDVQHLTVQLGDRTALQDITFHAERGNFVAVLGPNGGGKSTLLKAILGLITPISGSISISSDASGTERGTIGYVPQIKSLDRTFPALAIELVVTSIIRRWPGRISVEERRTALHALEKVGADHLANRAISTLSGGEVQRVYLARAIIREPRLLLLDEPESGIDISGTQDLYSLLEAFHREANACIIMVTHDWDVALHHATHVLLVNTRQNAFGSPSEALTEEAVRNTFGHVGHKHETLIGGTYPPGGDHHG